MKTIYFDTSIYNKLIIDEVIKSKIISLKNKGKIQIIFSEYLFDELLCTYLKDPNKTKKIFQCVLEIISEKVLKQMEILIKDEVYSFILGDSQRRKIFFDQEQRESIFKTMKKLARGDDVPNKKSIQDILVLKKERLRNINDVYKKYQPKKTLNDGKRSSFEEFYTSISTKKEENEFLIKLLENKIQVEKRFFQKIIGNINNLQYLRSYLRMISAYQYALSDYFQRPGRGDDYDLRHAIVASSLDLFVCDHNFKKIIQWALPGNNILTFDEYLTRI